MSDDKGKMLVSRAEGYKFNSKEFTIREIACMKQGRAHAACAVFEEKVVVSDGIRDVGDFAAVEAYDHVEDAWKYIPSMNVKKYNHSLIVMRNDVYVFRSNPEPNCELYCSGDKYFVLLVPLQNRLKIIYLVSQKCF